MPKKTSAQPTVRDTDPWHWVDTAVTDTAKTRRTRLTEKYDGVMGELDKWIPENFQREFRAARDRLLDRGYTAKQIRDLIAQEMRRYRNALRNPEKPISYQGFLWPPAVARDVSLLAHLKTAVRLRPRKGLAFLTDQGHAEKVWKGERYGQHQSRIAKHPRGKIEEANGQTIDQIIGRLALNRPDDRAKDLWDAFHGQLDNHGLDPQYTSTGNIQFDFKERRTSRTFGSFEKTVSQYRTGRKKLP